MRIPEIDPVARILDEFREAIPPGARKVGEGPARTGGAIGDVRMEQGVGNVAEFLSGDFGGGPLSRKGIEDEEE